MGENGDSAPYYYEAFPLAGTLYGPARYLNEKQKRYRIMNAEEMDFYKKKVKETGGFDVDGCTGFLPGNIVPIRPKSSTFQYAEEATKFAIRKHAKQEGKRIEFVRLVKANSQPVAGSRYYLTFQAKDETDGVVKTYRAIVWAKAPRGFEVTFFEQVQDGKEMGERNDDVHSTKISNEKTDNLGKGEKRVASQAEVYSRARGSSSSKGRMAFDGNVDHLEDNRGKVSESKPCKLVANGYLVLLEEIRSQNPSWTYARARKFASKRWRSLPYSERDAYVIEARKRLMEKQAVCIEK